ncbi:IclR family transcriptional regulator [Rugosimonospora africana]|uniref:IclR family transcriptional regulator n=1 Tax=Rugosimonospora africana TaxID=556532 RepID=A0A8J3VPQ6_9ACTN|nr:IclR family transcriptional regulator [Rugosimonospora africana]GIH14335.1 IclR family transcriptional regulator [Rugosimonospora africana]
MSSPTTTQSPSAIAKLVAVAEALIEQRRLSRIANTAGLPISTVHRILQELVAHGWVREGDEHDYVLGPGLIRLAARAADDSDLARAARPALRALCERTGYTVHFAVRQGDEAVYFEKLEGRGAYGIQSRVGASVSLHCTAMGKAILAALPDDEVRRIAARSGLPRRMPNTLTTPDALLANLASVRARGWALDDEENVSRVRCVGAAVVNHGAEPIGAVSVSGLSFDIARAQVARLAPMVVRAAREVSAALNTRA